MTVNEWLKELECWLACRKLYCYQKFKGMPSADNDILGSFL